MEFQPPVAATIPNAKKLAKELVDIMDRIGLIKEEQAQLELRRNHIRFVELPSVMNELEIESLGVDNHVITMTVNIQASLPKDPEKRTATLDWLNAHGHGGSIKQEIAADLPKGDDATAQLALEKLQEIGVPARLETSVHYQTYLAIAREIVRSGEVAPLDMMGIFIGQMAVVE